MAADAGGMVDHIYLHWTAGSYHQFFSDYHICIDGDGEIVVSGEGELTDYKSHTWKRNSNAIGIAICCCADAAAYADGRVDFGSVPPTPAQIDAMAKVVAVLCDELGLVVNKYNVMTHSEVADIDGYGPATTCERWDLWKLPNLPGNGEIMDGGDVIRGKAEWYRCHA